jgi:hypothetical protein
VYRIKVEVDPYAELKEAVVDPTKQVRIKGKGEWMDAGRIGSWCYRPENYEIRDKRKEDKTKVKKVKCWLGLMVFIYFGMKKIPQHVMSGNVSPCKTR